VVSMWEVSAVVSMWEVSAVVSMIGERVSIKGDERASSKGGMSSTGADRWG